MAEKKKVRVFIQDADGDHNFESDQVLAKPTEFINEVRQKGGYFVATKDREDKVTGVAFVPWHRIHFIRFEPVEDVSA